MVLLYMVLCCARVWCVCICVCLQFGTILDVLKGLGDADTGFLYTQIFVASLPLGFLTIPVITHCIKRFGLLHTFHVILLLGCGYSGCLLVS